MITGVRWQFFVYFNMNYDPCLNNYLEILKNKIVKNFVKIFLSFFDHSEELAVVIVFIYDSPKTFWS